MQTLLPRPILLIGLLTVCFAISSCARHAGLSKNDLEALQSIEVVRQGTPDLEVKTATGGVVKHAMKGPLGGILGHAYGKAVFSYMAGENTLPDYGELLVRKFADSVRSEVPGWPAMTVRGGAVQRRFDPQGHDLMEFRITEIGVSSTRGFFVKTSISIKKSSGHKVYSRRIHYQGSSLNRTHPLEAYFADGNRILMEEFRFSADYIIKELIASLKNQSDHP
jgi:hypothetical protein